MASSASVWRSEACSNVEPRERDAECRDASQDIGQPAAGNQGVVRFRRARCSTAAAARRAALSRETPLTWNRIFESRIPSPGFRLETAFNPRAGVDEPRAHLTKQFAIRLASVADARTQRGGRLCHRELVAQRDDLFQIEIGRHPSGEQRRAPGDVGRHVRVAIAIAAHPRPEAHRRDVEGQRASR